MGIRDECHARPIFVVGSPRSGTSVLTWALGQHPDLLLTEESNWFGSFAEQAAVAYAQGSARGERSQLSALGVTREAYLSSLGDAIDRMVLGGRSHVEAVSRETAQHSPMKTSPGFEISRDPRESKSRWVDGTPENSLQIPALLALFPRACFIHILRDADQVAASLIAFRDELGRPLVGSGGDAYVYWMRTAGACVDAENVLGPTVVYRVRHADLVADGEQVLRGIFDFIGEPFAPACLEPLQRRINSSFAAGAMPHVYPDARSAVVEQARHSSAEWLASRQSGRPDDVGRQRWRAEFDARVIEAQALQGNWNVAQQMLRQTRLALDVCTGLLLGNWLAALALWLQSGASRRWHWFALAFVMVLVCVWLRRAGLRALAVHLVRGGKRMRGSATDASAMH